MTNKPLEKQLCPRRTETSLGIQSAAGDTDYWENGNRWGSHSSDHWPIEAGNPPRTCTFCGGVHPEDALRLLDEGWEIDQTLKFYKAYLQPPGNGLHRRRMFEAIGSDVDMDRVEQIPHHASPVPSVKFYTQHANEQQIARVNEAIKLQTEIRLQ